MTVLAFAPTLYPAAAVSAAMAAIYLGAASCIMTPRSRAVTLGFGVWWVLVTFGTLAAIVGWKP